MTLEEARKIREIKRGSTYRALAEWYTNGKSSDQYTGINLCRDALKVLYPEHDIWSMYRPGTRFGKTFNDNNLSYYCMKRYEKWMFYGADEDKWWDYDLFYWWE